MNNTKLKYVDIFAGCGGLSLGLYNSGAWQGCFAIEKSPDAFKTLKHNLIDNHNHFCWPEWLPIKEFDINNVLDNYTCELKKLRGQVDLVAGGPPCQGFSAAGKRRENDDRNKLIDSYVKFIRLVQPKVIFFENVKGFMQKFDKNKEKGRRYSEYVIDSLQKSSLKFDYCGYNVFGQLVDFSEYGIPQKRTRYILVGIRKDISNATSSDFFSIIRNNKEDFLIKKGLGITTTLENAISDLLTEHTVPSPDSLGFNSGVYRKIENNYQKLLREGVVSFLPDSHRIANHNSDTIKKFTEFLNYSNDNKALSREILDKFNSKKRTVIPLVSYRPTPTITTLPDDYLHYSEPRIFTVREYARIQSFNDWFEFKGKYTTGGKLRTKEVPRYSQVGNAIPPLFGEQVGLTLTELIYKCRIN